ncbi:hypothetical protein SAMN04490248_1485 [Salinihabitans flavidus]|uniref:Secreted protein n=1 Tax=Salinihabitans flavidus TaxID=569882 RepID=A0A1H8W893_9RHOB|nr:hypothetical protein [Salinihabitans flavidus]SEP23733.1 hypothetical protein SAMN04490248_1485 [Salinihabitans flavidus]
MRNSVLSLNVILLGLVAVTPVVAQGNVDVDVEVEEIAILEVDQSKGTMLIDDASFTVMGNPSDEGSVLDSGEGNYASVGLRTNTCLDFVLVEFPRSAGFRNVPDGAQLGVATGQASGNSLGVWPRVFRVDPATGAFRPDPAVHDGSDSDLAVTGLTGVTKDFCNGSHKLALGVGTAYDITLDGEQAFAPPDTYIIPLTGTLVP